MRAPFIAIPMDITTERFVSRASIIDTDTFEKEQQAKLPKPHVPVLSLNLDADLHRPSFNLGLTAVNGCDILFFDVWDGEHCFTNLANPGDPEVVAAMTAWDRAGFIRARLKGRGEMMLMRIPFKLAPVHRKAFKDSAETTNFLDTFQKTFQMLMEPDAIETVVRYRSKRQPAAVHVGFLATGHSEPGLPESERQPG